MIGSTRAVLGSQYFIALVIEVVTTEVHRQLEAKTQIGERCLPCVGISGSIKVHSYYLNEPPLTDVSDDYSKTKFQE